MKIDHPWESAFDTFQFKTLPYLQQYGKKIAALAKTNDNDALRVMEFYNMLYRSFEPVSLMLLEKHLKIVSKKLDEIY